MGLESLDINFQISDNEEISLRLKIDDTRINDGIIIFNLESLIDGKVMLSYKLENDKLIVLEKSIEILENIDIIQNILEEFLIQLNPNKMFGTEESEIQQVDDERIYNPEKIRVDTKSFSLFQIYDMIVKGDINLSPNFQRNLVWDNQRKSRLIESILLRIPLPMFYFAQDNEGVLSVIDGLQRLSAIRDFIENRFSLRKLEYLGEKCDGKYYDHSDSNKSIDEKYKRWFNMTQITVNIIDPSSPFKLKYDIFRRINTGGQPLNAQEIRNCLSSEELRGALSSMVQNESFKKATGYSIKDIRLEAQEMALRYILFFNKINSDSSLNNYNGNIESELNQLTDQLSKNSNLTLGVYVPLFIKAMENAYYLFGRYAFRKCKIEHINSNAPRQLINKAIFVSWSVLLSAFETEDIKKKFAFESFALPLAEKISLDDKLFQLLTYSTNSKVNIQAAFKAAIDIINNQEPGNEITN